MTERRKSILSLALTATLLISLTGCKKDTIKKEYNEKSQQYEFTGIVDSEAIKDLYIIEYIDSNNYKSIILVRKEQKSIVGTEYRDFDGNVIENGEKTHILEVKPLSSYTKDKKANYTGEEITEIYNQIKDEYNNTKKLEKK